MNDTEKKLLRLPLSEWDKILADKSLTARQRIDYLLLVDTNPHGPSAGKRGRPALAERQSKIRERLAKMRPAGKREWPFGQRECDRATYRKRYTRPGFDRSSIGTDIRRAKCCMSHGKQKISDAELAVSIGRDYHDLVKKLYTSKRADVAYGRGGQEHSEFVYAKSYNHPARWKDAGARMVYEGSKSYVVLENSRGTEVARYELPWPRTYKFKDLVDVNKKKRKKRVDMSA